VLIPMDRIVNFRTTSAKDNPEGKSILRNAWWPWYAKKEIEVIELIGIERRLAGIPKITHPPEWAHREASTSQKAAYAALQNIGRNLKFNEQACIMQPAVFDANGNRLVDVTLMEGPNTKSDSNIDAVVTRKNTEILLTMMADFLTIGHEQAGSFALVDSKTNLFAIAISAYLQSMCATINRHLIPRLIEANALPFDACPYMTHSDIETPDLEKLANYVSRLANVTALTPDPDLENELRRVAGLPLLSQASEV